MATKTPEELLQITYRPPDRDWRDPHVDFKARKGTWSYPGAPKNLKYMGFPNAREWSPTDDDWKLPENWKEIIQKGFKERLGRYRSLQVFMDTCVRCGACADKCHFSWARATPRTCRSCGRSCCEASTGTTSPLWASYWAAWQAGGS